MNIHFIGCEGASMKVLRSIAESEGHKTSGSDLSLEGHDERFCVGADEVIYSSAIPEDNPELRYAREHGIKILSRAEYLGEVARGYSLTVAVAGSHGKTTTTAMLGCIFAPYDPTVHLGGEYGGQCGRIGGKRYFITEACEYKRNFLHLSPRVSIVLNVELDHTDYYRDEDDIVNAFEVFSRSAPIRIVNGDDEKSKKLLSGRFITFGFGEGNEFCASGIRAGREGTGFTLKRGGRVLGEITLKVMGKHNIYNALAASAAALTLGLPFSDVKRGLEDFVGAGRRLEYLAKVGECDIFTDYAHHPRELASTVESLRGAGYKRIGIAFEPHTYSRTASLCDDFCRSLMLADDILLADIYAAREQPQDGVSSQLLCRKILDGGRAARCFPTFFQLNEAVQTLTEADDAFVFCGAGTIDIAARTFVKGGN